MISFLLFDAYGTLVELDDFYGRLQAGLVGQGLELPADAVRHAARREMKYYMSNAVRAKDDVSRQQVRRECAMVLAETLRAQQYFVPQDDEIVLQVLLDSIVFRAFPEVPGVLQELQAHGVPMGVLSNWDFGLSHELETLGLLHFFHFVLTSAEVGVPKPSPSFFERGLAQARSVRPGLQDSQCIYVGDHYENDVLGARHAGLTPLWLVRDRRDLTSGQTPEAPEAVPRLSSLNDILTMI